MGCWNETCMLSGLPIRMGDPVIVYFLAPSRRAGHNIYNCHDLYSPIGFGINGIYDDYGRVEEIKNNKAAIWTYKLLQHLTKTYRIKLSEKADEETVKLSNLFEYIKAAERGWLTLSEQKEKSTIPLTFIHAGLYKQILAEGGNRKRYNTGRTSYEMYTALADKYAEERKRIESTAKEKDAGILSLRYNGRGFTRHFTHYARNNAVTNFLLENLTDKTKDLRDLMVEIMVFETCMNISRMMWRTTAGKGSQAVELAIPGIIADFIDSTIAHEIQIWKKDGDSTCDPLKETLFDFEGD